jgi:hypothetical protein
VNRYLAKTRPETWLLIAMDTLVIAALIVEHGQMRGEMRAGFAVTHAEVVENRAWSAAVAQKLGVAQAEIDRMRGDVP